MKLLLRIACLLFEHDIISETPERGICSARLCIRCGHYDPPVIFPDPFECVK